ncbi:MAG: CopG family transcriptional regulator [Clostridiales bacterium]|jgi:putative iron-only hydrogenase system regulator|nr:CopG family transcriptional regulator [Clostridiales bacterium]HOB64143.1 CopG family transcriptional regulator [Clostridia bacterium]HOK81416.1 CopG family transcriptional regulator [Clostridia bacterium]HOL60716.1 CopG family transcriptional regulator [Clostridia bacterium]HPO53291.1 CopG family transcriptional regulator [Clostridia bacterium]
MKRVGVIGIVVKGNPSAGLEIQKLLSEYSDIIIGRMGVPDRVNGINAISVIVEGDNEKLSALTGKLGRLNNVSVKSAVTSVEI